MNPAATPAYAAVLTALLSGCGQKGPLYLPDKNATVVTAPAQPAQPAQTPDQPKKPDQDDSQSPQ